MDLWAFSIITMDASTIAPIAMAIPPRLMIFDPIPKSFMSRNGRAMVRGRTMSMMSVERKCIKNRPIISMTIMLSSSRVVFRVFMADSMSPERS